MFLATKVYSKNWLEKAHWVLFFNFRGGGEPLFQEMGPKRRIPKKLFEQIC